MRIKRSALALALALTLALTLALALALRVLSRTAHAKVEAEPHNFISVVESVHKTEKQNTKFPQLLLQKMNICIY